MALRHVTKRYNQFTAVSDISLEVHAGEFFTFLGPSGSGKTTTLMMIAGLIAPSGGEIWIGDENVTAVPPRLRNVGVVFQHYALFPHMTVAENVAYPLRMRKVPRCDLAARVTRTLELVHLDALGHRFPDQLSGGQQQRVAIARALVFEPPVLLLDEPLGALDKKLRETMQDEIRALKKRLGLTIIHVTHDQTEALTMSDQIAVIRNGRVEQIGSPRRLYEQPETSFIANFLGESTLFYGQLESFDGAGLALVRLRTGFIIRARGHMPLTQGTTVMAVIRPERVHLGGAAQHDNRFDGNVADVVYTGETVRYRLLLTSGDLVSCTIPNTEGQRGDIIPGAPITVSWRAEDVHLFAEPSKLIRDT